MKRILIFFMICVSCAACAFAQTSGSRRNTQQRNTSTSRSTRTTNTHRTASTRNASTASAPSQNSRATSNTSSTQQPQTENASQNAANNPPIIDIVPGSLRIEETNNNGAIDANESGSLKFQVANTGMSTAVGCKIIVNASGSTQGVSFGSASAPAIKVGETVNISVPFSSDINTEDGRLTFSVKVEEPNGFGTDFIDYSVRTHAFEAPNVQIRNYQIQSDKGQILQKKLPFKLEIEVSNYSSHNAENVKASIELPQNVILLGDTKQSVSIGSLKGYTSKVLSFNLIVNNNYTSSSIPIKILLSERYGKYAHSKELKFTIGDRFSNTVLKPWAIIEPNVQVETPKEEENKVFTSVVQMMPQFPGGDEALMNYIASHMQYPPMAQEQGIQGKVIVQFVVTKTGDVGEVKVVRSLSPDCDEEVKRVVKGLPLFTPGKQNGQPVNVWLTLPVTFGLNDDKPHTAPVRTKLKVFDFAEEMPQFPGGDKALLKYMTSHIKYPPMAQEQGVKGDCIVQFVVTKTGSIGHIKIARSLSPECDEEAKRVVRGLPKFSPGKQDGQPVNVWFTLPVTFKPQK